MTAQVTQVALTHGRPGAAAARGRGHRRGPRPRLARQPRAFRREPEGLARRDHRPGRRDRLGQDHPRQDRGRPRPAARRPGPVRRDGDLGPARRRQAARAPHRPHPAGLPGPAALARPGPDRRGHRRRGPEDPRRPVRQRDRGPRRGRARQGRARRGAAAPAARADLRRPAAAGLDRQGAGGRPEAAAVRRAGQRARREQQELHPAAARRTARQPRPADRDHLARPVLAGRHRRPRGRALPGPDRRGRPGGPGIHPAAPPVHRAADGVGSQRQAGDSGSSSVHQLRRTTADPEPPCRRRRVRLRRALPVRCRRLRRPAAA